MLSKLLDNKGQKQGQPENGAHQCQCKPDEHKNNHEGTTDKAVENLQSLHGQSPRKSFPALFVEPLVLASKGFRTDDMLVSLGLRIACYPSLISLGILSKNLF